MSLLRRIVQNPTVSRAVPVAKAFIPYPLGRNPPEIRKFNREGLDRRPISLRYRVTAMIELCDLDQAARIASLAVSERFRVDRDTVFICNSVIGAMCEAKRYDDAISLFDYFFNESRSPPNTLSCNLIIKAHCDQGLVDDALELYRHIVLLGGGLAPGIETYTILTKALVDAKRFDEACDLVRSMSRGSGSFMVYDILIRGFLDSGQFVKASQIFDELKDPNSRLSGRDYRKAIGTFKVSFMRYWFKAGKEEEAMEIFLDLKGNPEGLESIVVNRVLEVLVEQGKDTEALDLFREMAEVCDPETVDIMLRAFSEMPQLFGRVRKACYRTMIRRLCGQGNMAKAEELFDEMFADHGEDDPMVGGPDVSTFRAMINGYAKLGRVDDVIKMLNKMRISTIRKIAIHRAT